MSTLHLLCVAMQVLVKKSTQRLFFMLLRQKKEETQLDVYSPDTDVFILLIRRYPQLPKETSFVTGRGTQQRRKRIKKIYDELGPAKAAALPGFHAFTELTLQDLWRESYSVGKKFNQVDEDVIQAFTDLGSSEEISENICIAIEKFVADFIILNIR